MDRDGEVFGGVFDVRQRQGGAGEGAPGESWWLMNVAGG